MKKYDLAKKVGLKLGVPASTVNKILQEATEEIKHQVAEGERVTFGGFGTFHPKFKKATVGQDITRNKRIPIPERFVPGFIPSDDFKNKLLTLKK